MKTHVGSKHFHLSHYCFHAWDCILQADGSCSSSFDKAHEVRILVYGYQCFQGHLVGSESWAILSIRDPSNAAMCYLDGVDGIEDAHGGDGAGWSIPREILWIDSTCMATDHVS